MPVGVRGQLRAACLRHLGEPLLGALEQPGELRPPRCQDGAELRLGRVHAGLVPLWIAMIPPAVSTQRTSSSPAFASPAPSSRGPGKRRTLEGRYV